MTTPRLVGSRYELGELIGYGGMAEVHRGRDIRLGRDVAIKLLRADLARDPSFLHRFRREAQAAAGLNHPSIVSVYDTGEDIGPDGTPQPYIVMEYIEGRTLRDVLKTEGHLPDRRAMEITADVCGALDFSHRSGIVHRDIKPANVMITLAGAVKVMDFGIARAVADNAATVTQTAHVIGTAQYLSPEQARGESVDARSDVYSTGCLLYELVTGSPPFQGDSPVAVAYQHVRETPPPPSSRNPLTSRAVDSIVMKALAKNTLNRYQSAGEMRTDLQRALANQPVNAEAVMTDAERTQLMSRTAPPPVALRRAEEVTDDYRDDRRSGLMWAAIVIVLLLLIGGAAYAIVAINNNDKVKSTSVPNVIGQLPSAAEASIKNAGLVPQNGGNTSDACDNGQKVEVGRVCQVLPQGGQSVKDQSTVKYLLYAVATVQVPSLVGADYNDAANQLNALGLVPKRKNVDAGGTAGQVTAQDKPPFTTVAKGSTVTLSVSSGKVVLIDVGNKTFPDAQVALNKAGWANVVQAATTTPTTTQSQDGKVASESPTPGVAYPQSTQITLTLYSYAPPSPTCTTPPPSTTPTATGTGTGTPTGAPTTTAGGLPPC